MAEQDEKRITVKVAFNYFQAGNWERALEEYKKLIEIDPMDFLIHNMLAEIYIRKHDDTAAVRELFKAASLLQATNNLEKALMAYARILRLDPENADALPRIEEVLQARLLEIDDVAERGSVRHALELCERLAERLPGDARIEQKMAVLQARADGSAAAPSTVAVEPPPPPSGLASQAGRVAPARHPAASEPVLRREEVVKNLYAMADHYEKKQSWDEAVEAYITILRFTPDDDSARAKLHGLYRKITRQDKAGEVWERINVEDKKRVERAKAIAKDAPKPEAFTPLVKPAAKNMTAKLEEMERLRLQAEEKLRRSVEDRRTRDRIRDERPAEPAGVGTVPEPAAEDREIAVLLNQAHMYLQQNLLVDAMRLCQKILEINPQSAEVRVLLQAIFEKKKI